MIGTGRYICVQTPGILAWIIRKATKSDYNHAFIAGPDGRIVQANLTGVREGKLSEYAGAIACANLRDLITPVQGWEIWEAALAMVNEPYNWPDLLVLGAEDFGWHWRLLFRLLGKPHWRICSQLVVVAGQAAKPPANWLCDGDTYADEVTPAALARRPGVVPVSLS